METTTTDKQAQQTKQTRGQWIEAAITKYRTENIPTLTNFSLEAVEGELQDVLTKFYVNESNTQIAIDDYTKQQVAKVARYLNGGSQRWGLRLMGTVGNGKTTMARSIYHTIRFMGGYRLAKQFGCLFYKATDIVKMVSSKNTERFNGCKRTDVLIIDDLGQEATEVLNYGNANAPIIEIIMERYEAHKLTIVTSNLNNEDMLKKYGERITDRMTQMFATLIYDHASYRK